MHAVRVSPPPIDSPRPSAPELQLPATAPTSTTQEELQAVGRNLNIVAWLSSGFGALVSILGVCAVVLGAAIWTIDRAEAKGAEAGKQEVQLHYFPLERRVGQNEKFIDFMASEQRATREDFRRLAEGKPLPPMAPLPERDAGL